jgi:hypothetical protein
MSKDTRNEMRGRRIMSLPVAKKEHNIATEAIIWAERRAREIGSWLKQHKEVKARPNISGWLHTASHLGTMNTCEYPLQHSGGVGGHRWYWLQLGRQREGSRNTSHEVGCSGDAADCSHRMPRIAIAAEWALFQHPNFGCCQNPGIGQSWQIPSTASLRRLAIRMIDESAAYSMPNQCCDNEAIGRYRKMVRIPLLGRSNSVKLAKFLYHYYSSGYFKIL